MRTPNDLLHLALIALLAACKRDVPIQPAQNAICFEQRNGPGFVIPDGPDYELVRPEDVFFQPQIDAQDPNILVVGLEHYNDSIGVPSLRNEIWRFDLATMQGTKVIDSDPWFLDAITMNKHGWIAYRGSAGLQVVHQDGYGHQVMNSSERGYWNPAGDTLTFSSHEKTWSKAVYDGTKWAIVNIDGIAPPMFWGKAEQSPSRYYSPNGSFWAEWKYDDTTYLNYTWSIYRRSNELVAQIPIRGSSPSDPTFSPDHAYMFWGAQFQESSDLSAIFRLDLANKSVVKLREYHSNENFYQHLGVSSDGKKLIFTRYIWTGITGTIITQDIGIWQMDINGCNETRLLLDVHR